MRTELADGVKVEAEMEACADLNKKKISDLEIANNDLNRVRLPSYIYYTHTYTYIHFIVM